jgi:four helix bundle protein
MSDRFRFEGLQIWLKAVEIGEMLYDIADDLEKRRMFRFVDQIRGAALSISNNIAEGSGSSSNREFAQFLNIARRSVFENANMVVVFARRGLLSSAQRDAILDALREESQMLGAFARTLRLRTATVGAIAVLFLAATSVVTLSSLNL